jgi:CheY-like chemotaxis protein
MSVHRVLSVGQCMADHSQLSRFLRSAFGTVVVSAETAGEAVQRMRQEAFDLVLVNRVFDADGESGIEWIRQVQADEQLKEIPIVLVSNYEDAQAEAVAAGARPGFGKASLQAPHTIERLREYLQPAKQE